MAQMVIEPYVSVGAIRLGTAPDEVAAAVGPPSRITASRKGRREEHRAGCIVRYARTSTKVDEVSLFPPAEPVLLGIELFAQTDRYVELCAADGRPYEDSGFIVLLKLGVMLTGFHDDDRSQLAVTVISRGMVDERDPRLKPFKTPRMR